MNRLTACLAALALLGATATAEAQGGTLTSGAATFDVNGYGFGPATVDLTITSGDDHLFALWWYYRLAGAVDETALPGPDSETFVGNVATLTWTDIDSTGLNMTLVLTLTSTGAGNATVTEVLTVTNTNTAAVVINTFAYTDIELDDTSAGDVGSAGSSATELLVAETSMARFTGTGASAFQVAEYPGISDLFEDGAVTNLDNTGAAFPAGDWSGAFQWTAQTLAGSGGTATYTAAVTVDEGGATTDGGVADGGTLADGGAATDGGIADDGGATGDAGAMDDGGPMADAGTPPMVDSGTPPTGDSGAPPVTDSGVPGVDSGTGGTDRGGCSCRVQSDRGPSPGGPLLALLVIGALAIRRRGL